MPHLLQRVGVFLPQEILSLVPSYKESKTVIRKLGGKRVSLSKKRLKVFKQKGIECVNCGLKGTFFALEKHRDVQTEKYHFNLYATDPNTGEEVMMTVDHIIPKAKGGSNKYKNLQTMCEPCNVKKGACLKEEHKNEQAND